jgi:DNA ligase (NAD+)
VALLEPVNIAGSTVARATLHNQEYIDMLELGIGDQVSISKRGDIIPAVDEVLEKNQENPTIYKYPDKCPFCSSVLVKDGAHHFCKNKQCPERKRRSLIHFTGKNQMDIDTLGEKTISLLFDRGFIKTIPDIYRFNYDLLLGEEGFKEKKIANIKKSLQQSKTRPFRKVLTALGFDGLGEKAVADLIHNGFDSIDKIIAAAQKGDSQIFSAIEGFGETTASLILKHFTRPENLALIRELKQVGLHLSEQSVAGSSVAQIFKDQSWVLTGTFEHFNPRSLAAQEIERRGGRISSSLSAKTHALLAGKSPGSKLARARDLGIPVISEDEFLKLLLGSP